MPNIEITEGELIDRIAIQNVKADNGYSGDGGYDNTYKNSELFKMLYDIHSAMYPLHDILVKTKNIELKAYLGEVILKLNGIRTKLKGESRTYA